MSSRSASYVPGFMWSTYRLKPQSSSNSTNQGNIMQRPTVAQKRDVFRELHNDGCFVIPNPWDMGSAHALSSLGFKALATTSSGLAWSMARPDGTLTRDETL